ncbi:MAG: MBL fold metallo-hydrolase [Spirochaetales bacterium]|nr:MBL fold metallo-hydrolase [Spirochaetales bacterium]
MQFTSHGAAQVVTGSCHRVETEEFSFLIDCGMFQGGKELARRNYDDFGFDPKKLDFMILTHGHIDHCGLLPKLVKQGFSGKIYATSATVDLIPIMLRDAAYIQEKDTEHENKRRSRQGIPSRAPLYTRDDAEKVLPLLSPLEYRTPLSIGDSLKFILQDAGHVLGSAIVELLITEKDKLYKIVFSGDLGQNNVPIIEDPALIEKADYIFIESTYGDRLHDTRLPRDKQLMNVIKKTINRGGKVFIPSFALERTQELLYALSELQTKNSDFPEVPIYLDSPLAIKITEVFKKHPELYDADAKFRKDQPFSFPNLKCTLETEESRDISKSNEPSIVIAGSGMCTAGRIRHHLRHGIDKPQNTLLFVGYQAPGSLGRILLDGAKEIKMMGRTFDVKAEIQRIGSFSAHADQKGLTQWLQVFSPKPIKVFLVHGEEDTIANFSKHLKEQGFSTGISKQSESIIIN